MGSRLAKKALVALDSFKGTFTSRELGERVSRGLGDSDYIVVSDGGEGFVDAILANDRRARPFWIAVVDDMGKPIRIKAAASGPDAYFEVASIVGLPKYPGVSAIKKTDAGIGMAVAALEKRKATKNVFIGLGGSSVSLAGFDAARAVGTKFFSDGTEFKGGWRNFPGDLVADVPTFKKRYYACTDVVNPLFGANGAARTFGKQKFMTAGQIKSADAFMKKYARAFGGSQALEPGTGAAGGLGFFAQAVLKAKTVSGSRDHRKKRLH